MSAHKPATAPGIDLAALGFTRQELQDRVVELATARLRGSEFSDEDGEPVSGDSSLTRSLTAAIKKRVDRAIDNLGDKHVLPGVAAMIEAITLEQTNKWGEKTGKPMTFIEYLVERADAYMRETVDYQGKPRDADRYSSSWTGTQTRIAHMVNAHLHYSIDQAMRQALATANSSIAKGLEETVKIKLAEVAAKLAVNVEVKR